MNINQIKVNKSFGGATRYYEHSSEITGTPMKFSCFVPEQETADNAIIWLSGLTCTEENFISKAGAQRVLADTGTMIICPDTSPRGLDLPGEHESYDFGSGAGFYVNATTETYRDHYRMYDYIVQEIVEILKTQFKVQRISIMGHSMGGHGALTLGLKEADLFRSVSAFCPIVNPLQCPWGRKAFKGYFGKTAEEMGAQHDATELIKNGITRKDTILIEQGLADEFFKEQLLTDNFVKACEAAGQEVQVNYRAGYDHSYYFIASFIEDHLRFHLNALEKI